MTNELAINVLKSHYHKNPRTSYSLMVKQATEMAIEAIEERKTGKWIETGYIGNDNYRFECSCCHHSDEHTKSVVVSYCWNCGAKMEVDE